MTSSLLIGKYKCNNHMTDNQKKMVMAKSLIRDFEKEKEPERLREASIFLGNIDLEIENNRLNRIQVRNACLTLWLNLLQIIDDHLDISFDPQKGFVMHEDSPFNLDKDANLVSDTLEISKRRKASEENAKEMENHRLQVQFSRLNETFSTLAKEFIQQSYTSISSDQLELKTEIERNLKSNDRKNEFLKLLILDIKH